MRALYRVRAVCEQLSQVALVSLSCMCIDSFSLGIAPNKNTSHKLTARQNKNAAARGFCCCVLQILPKHSQPPPALRVERRTSSLSSSWRAPSAHAFLASGTTVLLPVYTSNSALHQLGPAAFPQVEQHLRSPCIPKRSL